MTWLIGRDEHQLGALKRQIRQHAEKLFDEAVTEASKRWRKMHRN